MPAEEAVPHGLGKPFHGQLGCSQVPWDHCFCEDLLKSLAPSLRRSPRPLEVGPGAISKVSEPGELSYEDTPADPGRSSSRELERWSLDLWQLPPQT